MRNRREGLAGCWRLTAISRLGFARIWIGCSLWFLVVSALSTSASDQHIYRSKFKSGADRQYWSDARSFSPPDKRTRLLGPFRRDESTTLTLTDLPRHKMMRLQAKLYVLDTADGTLPDQHDDWSINIVGGPCLLHTSFDNRWSIKNRSDVDPAGRGQAYPDEVGGALHPGRTGAIKLRALGFNGNQAHAISGFSYAVEYSVQLVFRRPETGELALRFGGSFTGLPDEAWALGDVSVTGIIAVPVEADEEIFEWTWQDLRNANPIQANSAANLFLQTGDAGLEYVLSRLATEGVGISNEQKAALKERFAAALTKLQSDKFVDRIEATQTLSDLGVPVIPLIEAELASPELDPDTSGRLLGVLKRLGQPPKRGEVKRLEKLARSRIKRLLRVANTEASTSALKKLIERDRGTSQAMIPVVMLAKDAKVIGGREPGFALNAERAAYANWSRTDDSLYWFPETIAAGEYEVVVELASGDGVGGDQFEVFIAGELLHAMVPDSDAASALRFQKRSVGKALITNDARHQLFVRPINIRGECLMELKRVELIPVAN